MIILVSITEIRFVYNIMYLVWKLIYKSTFISGLNVDQLLW